MSNFSNNENNNNENENSEDTFHNKIIYGIYRGDITPYTLRKYLTDDKYKHLINKTNYRGETLLHTAVSTPYKKVNIIKILLRLGADPNIASDDGYTPFIMFVDGWEYNVKKFGKDNVLKIFERFLDNGAISQQKSAIKLINSYIKENAMGFMAAKRLINSFERRKQVLTAYKRGPMGSNEIENATNNTKKNHKGGKRRSNKSVKKFKSYKITRRRLHKKRHTYKKN
jgi:hypothetical protein